MKFHELLIMLAIEHWRRYGKPPTLPVRQWLFQPWVGEFLRTYEAPRWVAAQWAVARRTTP